MCFWFIMNFSTNLRLERDFEERSTASLSFFKLPKNFLAIFFSFLFNCFGCWILLPNSLQYPVSGVLWCVTCGWETPRSSPKELEEVGGAVKGKTVALQWIKGVVSVWSFQKKSAVCFKTKGLWRQRDSVSDAFKWVKNKRLSVWIIIWAEWVCCIALFLHSFKMCFPSIFHSSFYFCFLFFFFHVGISLFSLQALTAHLLSQLHCCFVFGSLLLHFFFVDKKENKVSHLWYKCDVAAHLK